VPIGVILFEQDPKYMDHLHTIWVNDFIKNLGQSSSIYLLDLNVDMTSNIRDRRIWNWVIGIHKELDITGKSVMIGELDLRNDEQILRFVECKFRNLEIIGLRTADENFTLSDPSGVRYPPSGFSETLSWWGIPEVMRGNWILRSNKSITENDITFLYSYSGSPIPISAPTEPGISPVPDGIIDKQPTGWVMLVRLTLLVFTLFFLWNLISFLSWFQHRHQPLAIIAWFCLFFAVLLSIPILYSLVGPGWWEIFGAWFTILILTLNFFGFTLGSWYLRNHQRFEERLIQWSPTIIVLFVIELIMVLVYWLL
jgi:hypothetical protein